MADHVIITLEDAFELQEEQRGNKSGDEGIIFEARCSYLLYFETIVLSILCPIIAWLGGLMGCILALVLFVQFYGSMKNWRLHLTRNAIHYNNQELVIPLNFVEQIDTGCVPATVCVTMKRINYNYMTLANRSSFSTECCRTTSKFETVTICFLYVKNPAEFVRTVQTCIDIAGNPH